MKGKLKIIEETKDRIDFQFSSIPVYYINAIRRYSIGKVPVYAIDKILVYENKTSLFDEYIAHRIGMIPLKVEGNPKDEELAFYLDEQGPKVIYSESLKSNSDKAKVAVEGIPIITLREGQSLRLEAKVKKGVGRTHAKFQSGISSYEIEEENGNLISGKMFVETLYQFSPREIVVKAIEEFEKEVEDFSSSLKKALKK